MTEGEESRLVERPPIEMYLPQEWALHKNILLNIFYWIFSITYLLEINYHKDW